MKKVCVVTGGGSGIGFAAAKEAAKKGYYVMIVGRNEKKLAGAVEELRKDGCEAEAYSCDVSDREHCFALARHAAECGAVKAVLHIAGMSPHMGDAEKIMQANALGTVNINDAFFEVIAEGGCVQGAGTSTIRVQGRGRLCDRHKFHFCLHGTVVYHAKEGLSACVHRPEAFYG